MASTISAHAGMARRADRRRDIAARLAAAAVVLALPIGLTISGLTGAPDEHEARSCRMRLETATAFDGSTYFKKVRICR